jgi:hypothetical protein
MLILGMVMNDKKLKSYENILKLYLEPKSKLEANCENPVIEKKQYFVSASVIKKLIKYFFDL